MRIIPNVSSLLSQERSVLVEHTEDGVLRKISFPLSLYKKNHFSGDNETFQCINDYWASLPDQQQSDIYAIYEDIRELFDSPTGNQELRDELTKLVTRLMDHHHTQDVVQWIKTRSQLKVPVGVEREYRYDVDKNTTVDKTYIYDDYIGLMAVSVILRTMIPVWAMFSKPVKDAIGKTLKEMYSFLLLSKSQLYKSTEMTRLLRYIKANINKDSYTGNHTLEGICSDDMPFYLLGLVCVRKLCLGEDLYSDNPRQNLAALVYTYVIDRPGPHGNDYSQQVRTKAIKKEGSGETSENSGGSLELYKARARVTVGRIAEMEYSLRDPVSLAIQLCPDADEVVLAKDMRRAMQTSLEMLSKDVQSPQVTMTQWVIAPVFPPQGMFYLEEDMVVRCCAIAETVLRHRGFSYLALLATSTPIIEEDSVRITPVGSKSQIGEDMIKALSVNFPFRREPKRKMENNTSFDFVQEDIKRLYSDFQRQVWRATADESLVRLVLGTHVRRIPVLANMRKDIGQMLIQAEEQFN